MSRGIIKGKACQKLWKVHLAILLLVHLLSWGIYFLLSICLAFEVHIKVKREELENGYVMFILFFEDFKL